MFDRFAQWAANQVSRAWFFALCVSLIVIWLPTTVLLPFDVSQLLINTATTIITFLLVALLQNSQRRSEGALQAKLDALATGLRDLMVHVSHDSCAVAGCDFQSDIAALEHTVGIESEITSEDV